MKIFTVEQIKEADRYTIQNEPILSINLMDRVAQKCTEWIFNNVKKHSHFAVFCGNGNNGGDGFAIARMLYLKGFDVVVFVRNINQEFSADASINLNQIREISGIEIKGFKDFDENIYKEKFLIIDAVFGTGFSGKLINEELDLIKKINAVKNLKISIDLPSGMFADKISEKNSTVVRADYTLTFQFWKKTFLHSETGVFAGKVVILDIGLDENFIENSLTDNFTLDEEIILKIFRARNEFSYKGSHGKVYVVAGSYGKVGAAVLAVRSVLKTGVGLTSCIAPDCAYDILQNSCPEAIFIKGGEKNIIEIEEQENVTYGIGPGLGSEEKTEKALLTFLGNYALPLVLDADALNIISKDQSYLKLIPKKSIITPHPKEFERLFGKTNDSFERTGLAKTKAKEYDIYIVLKNHHTQIFTPEEKVFYNITGNSGLAKGGSGDILLGIITSLLAENYTPEEASLLGVWLHGRAADFAAGKYSKESMQPTDVMNEIGNVFLELNKKATTQL